MSARITDNPRDFAFVDDHLPTELDNVLRDIQDLRYAAHRTNRLLSRLNTVVLVLGVLMIGMFAYQAGWLTLGVEWVSSFLWRK